MPDAIFDPGCCRLIEFQLHHHSRPAHDGERIFNKCVEVEMERNLVGKIGGRHGLDPFHREHARLVAQMTVTDEIEPTRGVPESIGIDVSTSHPATGRGIVPHLDARLVHDGLCDPLDHFVMMPIALMRAKSDGEGVFKLLGQFQPLWGQGRRGFAQGRLQRGMQLRPFERRNEAAADRQGHEFAGREAKRRNVAEPLQEFPSHLTVETFRHERPTDRFNGRKVPAKRARMACGGGIYRFGELIECESVT